MRKKFIIGMLSVFAFFAMTSNLISAPSYGMAGCGLGSIVISKNNILQIFAATTNGTSYNQLFGITSGTSNCSSDGIVKNDKVQEVFVTVNFENLEQEMAKGEGEKLNAFAHLLGCPSNLAGKFGKMTQKNFGKIITEKTTPSFLIASVKEGIKEDASLSGCRI